MNELSFQRPEVLWISIVPAVLMVHAVVYRGHSIDVPVDDINWNRTFSLKTWTLAAKLNYLIQGLLLFVAILILAGPLGHDEVVPKVKKRSVEVCLDFSGSMEAPFDSSEGDSRSRFKAATDAIREFSTKENRKEDLISLSLFAKSAFPWVLPTTDRSAIACCADNVSPTSFTDDETGSTFIGKALRGATKRLAALDSRERLILVVTDGESQDLDSQRDIEAVVQLLRSENIIVYFAFTGNTLPPPVLHSVSNRTGGDVFSVVDNDGFDEFFSRIDELHPTEVPIPRRVSYIHLGFLPNAAGCLLIAIALLSLIGCRFTPW